MKTDIEIAREAEPQKIDTIAGQLGVGDEYLEHYGKFKCKVDLSINREKEYIAKQWSSDLVGENPKFVRE